MKIAIIGAGNMGGAVARGLAKGSLVKTSDITVSNPSRGKLEALKVEFPELNITCENSQAAAGADVVILAVKPWKIQEVIEEIKESIEFITDAKSANEFAAQINEFEHVGSSLMMARSLFAAKVKALGLIFNKETKIYSDAA